MADAVINFFRELLNNDILTIFIISMIPIVELRGAIPVAIEMGLSWFEAFGYAFLGSIIVAPILLLILMPILNAMKKIRCFRGLANAVEGMFQSKAESVRKKANKADSKNTEDIIKMVGVFLFVAIPLPLTGVWTGTAVAVFLGLGFWKSLLSVALGNISSGLIMTGLSLLFKDNLNLFLTIFMAVVLGVLVLNILYLVIKSQIKKKKQIASESEKIDTNQNSNQNENRIDKNSEDSIKNDNIKADNLENVKKEEKLEKLDDLQEDCGNNNKSKDNCNFSQQDTSAGGEIKQKIDSQNIKSKE